MQNRQPTENTNLIENEATLKKFYAQRKHVEYGIDLLKRESWFFVRHPGIAASLVLSIAITALGSRFAILSEEQYDEASADALEEYNTFETSEDVPCEQALPLDNVCDIHDRYHVYNETLDPDCKIQAQDLCDNLPRLPVVLSVGGVVVGVADFVGTAFYAMKVYQAETSPIPLPVRSMINQQELKITEETKPEELLQFLENKLDKINADIQRLEAKGIKLSSCYPTTGLFGVVRNMANNISAKIGSGYASIKEPTPQYPRGYGAV